MITKYFMPAEKAILIFALCILLLLHFHVPLVNGIPGIWEWNWRTPPLYSGYLVLLLFAIPNLIGLYWSLFKPDIPASAILAMFMLGLFVLQFAGIYLDIFDLNRIEEIIQSPFATSYHTDALRIADLKDWLTTFHTQELHLHSKTHPAGPILYHYLFITAFGQNIAPMAIGMSIAFLASLGIPAIWKLSSIYTEDRKTRLLCAALYSMTPGLVLFFPEFDQVYMALASVMLYAWIRAIHGSHGHIFYSALLLFLATSFAYNPLVLGTYYVLAATYFLYRSGDISTTLRWIGMVCIAHLLIIAGLYVLAFQAFGYNPLLAFISALSHQSELATILNRPHSIAIFYNLYDFVLGGGFITFSLCLVYALRISKQQDVLYNPANTLIIIGWLTIIITNITGLLNYETARVWLFMQPFLIIPAAITLQTFTNKNIIYIYLSSWLVLATIKANLVFIG